MRSWRLIGVLLAMALVAASCHEIHGWGSHTPAGNAFKNGPACTVTLLNNQTGCRYTVSTGAGTGFGTLPYALSSGHSNLYVNFATSIPKAAEYMGPAITLTSPIEINGSNITINAKGPEANGFAEGVTILDRGLILDGASDVSIRGVALRNRYPLDGSRTTPSSWKIDDGIEVRNSDNVLIQNNSLTDWGDSAIDVIDSNNVTIAYNVMGSNDPLRRSDVKSRWLDSGDKYHYERGMLINRSFRVSIHHNLIIGSHIRNPLVMRKSSDPAQPENPSVEISYNVIAGWGHSTSGRGPILRGPVNANIVGNIFSASQTINTGQGDPAKALKVCSPGSSTSDCDTGGGYGMEASAWVTGNVSLNLSGGTISPTSSTHPDQQSTLWGPIGGEELSDLAAHADGVCSARQAGAYFFDASVGANGQAIREPVDATQISTYAPKAMAYCAAQ